MHPVDLIIRVATSAAVFLALMPAAHAKNISFSGMVKAESVRSLVAKAQAASAAGDRNITISLDSVGGDLGAALWAMPILRGLGVNTSVSQTCWSACTVLFASGVRRQAAWDATFIFHGVGTKKKNQKLFGKGVAKDVHAKLVADYSVRWQKAISTASPSLAASLGSRNTLRRGQWELTGRELHRYGYVTD